MDHYIQSHHMDRNMDQRMDLHMDHSMGQSMDRITYKVICDIKYSSTLLET